MPPGFDIAEIDACLEELLELGANERVLRLQELERTRPDLAAKVTRALALAADAHTLGFTEAGRSLGLTSVQAPAPKIAGYTVLEEIGRGGMATVYAGLRDVHGSPQRVAIKVLQSALLSPIDRERFLNEQRILAQLQHPNIASLIDVGVIDDRPYMVLERVNGEAIDRQLQPGVANLQSTLTAIDRVTDALALAHEHFVIHRDIKPSNVLVDAQGHIKLIDFGIAKVLEGADGLGMATTITGTGPLTLRYASPEQLSGRPIGVGSDIYQLGLLMFRLLTGAWPFEESESEIPSQRTRADSRPLLASQTVRDPKLKRALQGDLDSILLRCLRFEPADRYRSMLDLKADLDRYRQHRPVLARRQTRGYVLSSFVYRHRLGVVLSVAALLLLAISVVSALKLAQRSQLYAQRTERILDTVASLFANANPYAAKPGEVSVSEAVSAASRRFIAEDDPDPLFQVQMLEQLAEIQRSLRDYSAEGELLSRATELVAQAQLDTDVASRVWVAVAESAFARGDFHEVDRLCAQAPEGLSATAKVRADYLRAKLAIERNQYDAAGALFEHLYAALQTRSMPTLFQQSVHNSYGILQRRLGNTDAAIAAYREAFALLDPEALADQEALLALPTNIAIAYGAAGRYAESEREFRRHLDTSVSRLGSAHPQVAIIVRNYATLLQRTARYQQGYQLLQEYLPAFEASDGQFFKAAYLDAIAVAALATGRDSEAVVAAFNGLELVLQIYSEDPDNYGPALDRLAWVLFESGDPARAARVAGYMHQLHDRGQLTEVPPRVDTILYIAQLIGLAAATSVQVDPLPDDSCDGAERLALESWLVHRRSPPPMPLPEGCNARQTGRLLALGLTAGDQNTDTSAEQLGSRFTLVATNPDAWPHPLSTEISARVDQLLARL